METSALASATWSPHDDLLLKNAVEGGASLEALGKGAVKFSRRFTHEELRDRWQSLLYDPDVSDHASAHMFELLNSGFIPSSKSIKSEYKGYRDVPEKRKRSIRKQYYAMRKRLRSEFFGSTHLGLLNKPIMHRCQDHGYNMRENHDGKFVSDSLRVQKAELDMLRNEFPETARDYATSVVGGSNNACSAECRNPIGDDYAKSIFRNEFPPDVSSLLTKDELCPSVLDIKCNEIPHAAKCNAPNSTKFRADKESGSVQVLPGKRLFRSFGKKELSACDSRLKNPRSDCGVGGSQLLNSPIVEGNSPLHVIGCSSSHPNFSIWKKMEKISVPSMPICKGSQGTSQFGETLLPDDVAGKGLRSSVFDIVQSGSISVLEHSSSDFIDASMASDGDFVDISDSLLNLSNEDEQPFTNVDEYSIGVVQVEDKVKLEHEMLNSRESNLPRAVQLDDVVKCESDLMMVKEPSKSTFNDTLPVKMEDIPSSSLHEHDAERHLDRNTPIAPALSVKPRESGNDIIFCTLNVEDPEIPCNDDIFLLIHPSPVFSFSNSPPFTRDTMSRSSISNRKIIEQQMRLFSNDKDSSQSSKWHQSARPDCYRDAHLTKPHLDSAHVGVPAANGSRSTVDNVTSYTFANRIPGKEISRAQLKDKDIVSSFLEMPQNAEACQGAAVELAINTTLSDPEESQSDDDVPYPSDVEAVILGMDLDPREEESFITKQAFRPEDSKTIVRLEQCVRSSLQRTLTNQGAFAILYGRHLLQYIKKTEVVLGRSTEDLEVDIDLREEGRANKISRQQAIIKMEADGSFSLKNIGKIAISVNGKSVYTGQSLILSSSCLIEISRMSLAFEINQMYIRHHMNAAARKMTEKQGLIGRQIISHE